MVEVDTTQWPTVYMKTDDLSTVADTQEFINEVERVLAREEPFGLIYLSETMDEAPKQKREKGAQKLYNAWLKANRERIGRYCLGIAMVTQATSMMKIYKPIIRLTVKLMMGVLGDIFFTQSEAESWLTEQLSMFYQKEKTNVENV